MAKALLITAEYLKDNTHIDENVDEKYLEVAIDDAQDARILPILGTALYDKLVNDVDSTGTTTGVYKTLLDNYVIPALKHWAVYEAMPFLILKINNKNIGKKSSETTEPSSTREVQWLMEQVQNKAERASEALKNYLIENEADYPEYTNAGSGVDTIHPDRDSQYDIGIWLGPDTGDNAKDEGCYE